MTRDELMARWVEAGRVLAKRDPVFFEAWIAGAETMIVGLVERMDLEACPREVEPS